MENKPRFVWWRDGANVVLALATTVLTLATAILAYIAHSQLTSLNATQSATYVLQLSEQISGDRFKIVRNAIDDHPGDFSLLKNGVKATAIDDYIGRFETIGSLVQFGVVADMMAYDEFSYDVEKAYCNTDVQATIRDARKSDRADAGLQAFYINFTNLAERFLVKDRKACRDLDTE